MKAEVLPDDERSFVGNMNEISKDKNVDKEVSLQATNSFQRAFQVPGGIPWSSRQNFKNEQTSYVRNCFTIPKKLVPSKNIENCRRR